MSVAIKNKANNKKLNAPILLSQDIREIEPGQLVYIRKKSIWNALLRNSRGRQSI